jgi:hypothetical protein
MIRYLVQTNLRPGDIEAVSRTLYPLKMRSRKHDRLVSETEVFPCILLIGIGQDGLMTVLVDDDALLHGKLSAIEAQLRGFGEILAREVE